MAWTTGGNDGAPGADPVDLHHEGEGGEGEVEDAVGDRRTHRQDRNPEPGEDLHQEGRREARDPGVKLAQLLLGVNSAFNHLHFTFFK
jgi:hypothetical protein